MKNTVVVFDADGAHVLINPKPEEYQTRTYAINPNLDAVHHLSPHAWAYEDGKVIPEHHVHAAKIEAGLLKKSETQKPRRAAHLTRKLIVSFICSLLANTTITFFILRYFHDANH